MNVVSFEKRLRKLEASHSVNPFDDLTSISDERLRQLIEDNLTKLGGKEASLAVMKAQANPAQWQAAIRMTDEWPDSWPL